MDISLIPGRYAKTELSIIADNNLQLIPIIIFRYIMWIAQVSEDRTERVRLHPGQATETRFPYIPGSVLYEYCNKHGLWKKEVE